MAYPPAPPKLGPRPHILGLQGSQPGLEAGLGAAEVGHHRLHLLPVLLAQRLGLPGALGSLLLLQLPADRTEAQLVTRLQGPISRAWGVPPPLLGGQVWRQWVGRL